MLNGKKTAVVAVAQRKESNTYSRCYKLSKGLGLSVLMLLCITEILYANQVPDNYGFTSTLTGLVGFAPPVDAYDLSINYLGNIFGNVGSALLAPNNVFISSIFRIFNLGIIGLASSVIAYGVGMATIGTAGQGVAMGKKMGQGFGFIFTRQVAAVTMLVPQFSGYSALQVMIMWVVIQGVHTANYIWWYVSGYVAERGSIIAAVVDQAAFDDTLGRLLGVEASKTDALTSQVNSTFKSNKNTVWKIYNMARCNALKNLTTTGYGSPYKVSYAKNSTTYDFGSCGSLTVTGDLTSNESSFIYNSTVNMMNSAVSSASSVGVDVATYYYSQQCANPHAVDSTATSCYPPAVSAEKMAEQCQSSAPGSSAGYSGTGFNQKTLECALVTAARSLTQDMLSTGSALSTIKSYTPGQNNTSQVDSTKTVYDGGWASIASSYFFFSSKVANATSNTATFETFAINENVNLDSDIRSLINIVTGSELSGVFTNFDKTIQTQFNLAEYGANTYAPPSNVTQYAGGSVTDAGNQIIDTVDSYRSNLVMGDGYSGSIREKGLSMTEVENIDPSTTIFNKNIPALDEITNAFSQNILYEWQATFVRDLGLLVFYPLTAMSRFANNLMIYSGGYMLVAQDKIVNSTIGTVEKYGAMVMTLSVVATLVEGYLAMMQNWSRTEQNACWFGPTMFGSMCIMIFFVPINFFVGLGMDIGFTIAQIISSVVFTALIGTLEFFFNQALAERFQYVSLFFAVGTPIMSLANFIAMYIPSLPVIIYTLAVMGWMIAVIEAMIGAPLILLGMTSPQGHDIFGSSVQTLMLIFAVFIRPATLVIAFVLSIIALSVMALMTTTLMLPITNSIIQEMIPIVSDNGLAAATIIMLILMTYLYVFLKMIEMTFSMVFRVPYAVLSWIGIPLSGISEQDAMNDLTGSIQSGSQGIGGAGSAFGQSAGSSQSLSGTSGQLGARAGE